MLGVKITACASHSIKTLVTAASGSARSLYCHEKATGIISIFTGNFS